MNVILENCIRLNYNGMYEFLISKIILQRFRSYQTMKEKKTGGKIWEKAKIFQKPIKRAKNEIYKKISRFFQTTILISGDRFQRHRLGNRSKCARILFLETVSLPPGISITGKFGSLWFLIRGETCVLVCRKVNSYDDKDR